MRGCRGSRLGIMDWKGLDMAIHLARRIVTLAFAGLMSTLQIPPTHDSTRAPSPAPNAPLPQQERIERGKKSLRTEKRRQTTAGARGATAKAKAAKPGRRPRVSTPAACTAPSAASPSRRQVSREEVGVGQVRDDDGAPYRLVVHVQTRLSVALRGFGQTTMTFNRRLLEPRRLATTLTSEVAKKTGVMEMAWNVPVNTVPCAISRSTHSHTVSSVSFPYPSLCVFSIPCFLPINRHLLNVVCQNRTHRLQYTV